MDIFSYLLLINAITFMLYAADKYASVRGWRRISEKNLHLFALMGGTPAAFIAQRLFRHKTRKADFQRKFLMVVILQAIAITAYLFLA